MVVSAEALARILSAVVAAAVASARIALAISPVVLIVVPVVPVLVAAVSVAVLLGAVPIVMRLPVPGRSPIVPVVAVRTSGRPAGPVAVALRSPTIAPPAVSVHQVSDRECTLY